MKQTSATTSTHSRVRIRRIGAALCAFAVCMELFPRTTHAQTTSQAASQEATTQQIQQLAAAVARAQTQLEASEQQIRELRRQLSALEERIATNGEGRAPQPANPTPGAAAATAAVAQQIDSLREQQAMQQSQIATQEQTKVESESKYPVRITGLILLNGFANTGATDVIQAPTLAAAGRGSTGASLRQTVLGLDARGPHLFGAASRADVRVDFFGGASS